MCRSLPGRETGVLGRRSTWGLGVLRTLTQGDCLLLSHQEHPFFTLHKTKKTDIAAFVKEILGEDS